MNQNCLNELKLSFCHRVFKYVANRSPFADMSDSAGTSWLDIKKEMVKHLISISDMKMEQMPKLVEGNQVAGQMRADLTI